MEGEVVVVFYWLEGDAFTEEAEMIAWNGGWKEVVDGWSLGAIVSFC